LSFSEIKIIDYYIIDQIKTMKYNKHGSMQSSSHREAMQKKQNQGQDYQHEVDINQ